MSSEPPSPANRRHAHLGKYQILAHIASGGMGAVYKALDTELNREVALKILPPEVTAGRPNFVERFRREASYGTRLRHENIVSLYEFGEVNSTYYMAMEFIDGPNLHDQVQQHGPLSPEEGRLILAQIARALEHAHQQGIVHRDIKPANILLAMVEGHRVAKLSDLGLARETREEEFRVTREGTTVGTVDYMAPEQARDSSAADVRSDIYSLGCTFYHMLAGGPPFAEGTMPERLYKHAEAEPPDVRRINPAVPVELAAVLRRMLAKKPADRYQTPAELLADLVKAPRTSRPAAEVAQPRAPRRPPTPSAGKETPASGITSVQEGSARSPAAASPPTGAARIAAGQFEWAQQMLGRGNYDDAIQVLLGCCKVDPANLSFHQALHTARLGRRRGRARQGWLASLRGLIAQVRLRLAKHAGKYDDVLLYGEQVLARRPKDLAAQLMMANAAEHLGQGELTSWLLEQARQQDGANPAVNRALARFHEHRGDYRQAAAYWERVTRALPLDVEASRKLNDLSAMETMERTRQKRRADEQTPPGVGPSGRA